jgi:hypothetical protein
MGHLFDGLERLDLLTVQKILAGAKKRIDQSDAHQARDVKKAEIGVIKAS